MKLPWGRGATIARMLRLLIALSGTKWWPLAELAAEVRAPVWAVRRDLLVFKDAGVPIECIPENPGRGVAGRYRLAKDWTRRFFKEY